MDKEEMCRCCPGHCCKHIGLLWTMEQIEAFAADPSLNRFHEEFVLMEECFSDNGDGTFDCQEYDEETGMCTIHDRRPKVCRNYHCGCDEMPDEGRFR